MKIKRILVLLLCVLLASSSAFAYTYGSGERYSKSDIVAKMEELLGGGGPSAAEPDRTEETAKTDSGWVYLSADAFVIGGGFVILPQKVRISEGDTVADVVFDYVSSDGETGLNAEYSGSADRDFYLKSLRASSLTFNVDEDFADWLGDVTEYFKPENPMDGMLGEMDVTDLSGWMCFVNGEAAPAGMSDCEVKDGDVIMLRYTVAGGMDMGGEAFGSADRPYARAVRLDGVVKGIADGDIDLYDSLDVINRVDVTQGEINGLLR